MGVTYDLYASAIVESFEDPVKRKLIRFQDGVERKRDHVWRHGTNFFCRYGGSFCIEPASVAPFEWPDDITKWPKCRKKLPGLGNSQLFTFIFLFFSSIFGCTLHSPLAGSSPFSLIHFFNIANR